MPKVVTQRCLEQDLNLRPTDRKPKCLTVAPRAASYYLLKAIIAAVKRVNRRRRRRKFIGDN